MEYIKHTMEYSSVMPLLTFLAVVRNGTLNWSVFPDISALFSTIVWSRVLQLPIRPRYTFEHKPPGFCKPHWLVRVGRWDPWTWLKSVALSSMPEIYVNPKVVPVPIHKQLYRSHTSCMHLARTGAWWFFLIPYWLHCAHDLQEFL